MQTVTHDWLDVYMVTVNWLKYSFPNILVSLECSVMHVYSWSAMHWVDYMADKILCPMHKSASMYTTAIQAESPRAYSRHCG